MIRGLRRRSRELVYRAGCSGFAKLGYEVELLHKRGAQAQETNEGDDAYRVWSSPGPVWTSWRADRRFCADFEGVAPHTVVDVDRCYVLHLLARQARKLSGDFAECGVFNGGTALLLARALARCDKTLMLFDSFQGLPPPDPEHDDFAEGTFRSASERAVRQLLAKEPSAVDFRVGWIPETFVGLEARTFAFVHVDVDLYRGALDCCDFFYPRLVPGGLMVFDDYGFPGTHGLRRAASEYFADRPEVPLPLPTGQAMVIKLPDPEADLG